MNTKVNRIRNKKEKIKLIYETFYKLLNKIGYDKLTTNQIAQEANISIGTIYHYFPKGKVDILKGTIKHISSNFIDFDEFKSINQENHVEQLKKFIEKYIKSHRNNYQYHLAIQMAELSHPKLFQSMNTSTNDFFWEIVQKLHDLNSFYKNIPKSILFHSLMIMYNTLEALVHRHLFITPIFNTDEELIEYLTQFLIFIMKFK
ncbi:MAG: TetR/AcrR family transcriptional regulator [Candidatus Lokiarchaeota archaeon]|nr:TetR/AcrR family transcriptional regulator [Candidatus Lokiarchaeota archaeon]